MLIRLTEIQRGVVNTSIVLKRKIVINTDYIQVIQKASQEYPFPNDFTTILMANGDRYRIEENFDYVCTKITENGTE